MNRFTITRWRCAVLAFVLALSGWLCGCTLDATGDFLVASEPSEPSLASITRVCPAGVNTLDACIRTVEQPSPLVTDRLIFVYGFLPVTQSCGMYPGLNITWQNTATGHTGSAFTREQIILPFTSGGCTTEWWTTSIELLPGPNRIVVTSQFQGQVSRDEVTVRYVGSG